MAPPLLGTVEREMVEREGDSRAKGRFQYLSDEMLSSLDSQGCCDIEESEGILNTICNLGHYI